MEVCMAKRTLLSRYLCLAGIFLCLFPAITVNGSELNQGVNTGIGGLSQVLELYYATKAVENVDKDTSSNLQSQKITGEELAMFASRFVGNPYVWGGTSLVHGTDCSGFVQSVYRHYGISLKRVSRDQAMTAGQEVEVSLDTLQAGDLLFYAKGGRVNHVAIYIGDGKIVHAAGKKYGIIFSDYNYRKVYKARRVITG